MLKNTPYINPIRHYRKLHSPYVDEQKIQIIIEETDLLITVPNSIDTETIVLLCHNFIAYLRENLKNYIAHEPRFFHSLKPFKRLKTQKESSLIQVMHEASKHADVGPFAAVAGSIAQITANMLFLWIKQMPNHKDFSTNIIVENGGDIYMYSEKDRIVGVLSDPKKKENVGIRIKQQACPLAFCASSSTIGHSLSFGNGEIAMVMAKNAALADALATSYCNALKTSKDINKVLKKAQKDFNIKSLHEPFSHEEIIQFLKQHHPIPWMDTEKKQEKKDQKSGILGVFLQCEGLIGAWGEIELVLV